MRFPERLEHSFGSKNCFKDCFAAWFSPQIEQQYHKNFENYRMNVEFMFFYRKWWTLIQLSINNCFQILSASFSVILKCVLPTISAILSIDLKNAIWLDLWLSFSALWTRPTALKVPEIVFSGRFPSELTLRLFYELILRFQIGWIKILNFARCLPPQLIPRTL